MKHRLMIFNFSVSYDIDKSLNIDGLSTWQWITCSVLAFGGIQRDFFFHSSPISFDKRNFNFQVAIRTLPKLLRNKLSSYDELTKFIRIVRATEVRTIKKALMLHYDQTFKSKWPRYPWELWYVLSRSCEVDESSRPQLTFFCLHLSTLSQHIVIAYPKYWSVAETAHLPMAVHSRQASNRARRSSECLIHSSCRAQIDLAPFSPSLTTHNKQFFKLVSFLVHDFSAVLTGEELFLLSQKF